MAVKAATGSYQIAAPFHHVFVFLVSDLRNVLRLGLRLIGAAGGNKQV
jgi:hypothetical protein